MELKVVASMASPIPATVSRTEAATQEIGRELLARAREAEKDEKLWSDVVGRLLESVRGDVKTMRALFRFISTYPSVRGNAKAVVKCLKENFEGTNLPAVMGLGTALGGISSLSDSMIAKTVDATMLKVARQFICAETLEEAGRVLHDIEAAGRFYTLDQQGEDVLSEKEADDYRDKVIRKIQMLGHRDRDRNISMKISGLSSAFRFNPLILVDGERSKEVRETIKERLRTIYKEAMAHNVFVMIDAEKYEHRELIAGIFMEVAMEDEFRHTDRLGIVVQGYLKDASKHLDELLAWRKERGTRIGIRLVKGAYYDLEGLWAEDAGWASPVWDKQRETDIAFEDMTDTLLEHANEIDVAIGSHNPRSIAHAIAKARELGVEEKLEIQMLYGMGNPLKPALVAMGVKVREYVPFGELITSLAYMIRRMQESTASGSALMRMSLKGLDPDLLLADPRVERDLAAAETTARSRHSRWSFIVGRGWLWGRGGVQATSNDGQVERGQRALEGSRVATFKNAVRADFSKADVRDRFQAALARVRRHFEEVVPVFIGGRVIKDRETQARENPSRVNETVAHVSLASPGDVAHAIEVARVAQPDWEAKGHHARADIMLRVADFLERDRDILAAWSVFEAGKTWQEAFADVDEMIDFCRFYALDMHDIADRNPLLQIRAEDTRIRYMARGLVGVIAPWNFGALMTGMMAAALVTGNAAIVKPSRQLSKLSWEIVQRFYEAGVPPEVLPFLPGKGSVIGNIIAESPEIDMLAFTGSAEVGLDISARGVGFGPGQRNIRKFLGELGGKNPMIGLDDADPDMFLNAVVRSAFGYGGQKCSAGSRVIVTPGIRQQFLDRLQTIVPGLMVGDPTDPAVFYGPMIDKGAYLKVGTTYTEIAAREGRLLVEPDQVPSGGYFVPPRVYVEVDPGARIAQEEIFGPVLVVMDARDEEHAIVLANQVPYALVAGLYTQHPTKRLTIPPRLRAGQVYVNRPNGITGALVGVHSFGGFGLSGTGLAAKTGAPGHILEYMVAQTVSIGRVESGHIS